MGIPFYRADGRIRCAQWRPPKAPRPEVLLDEVLPLVGALVGFAAAAGVGAATTGAAGAATPGGAATAPAAIGRPRRSAGLCAVFLADSVARSGSAESSLGVVCGA